jgi:hypothetical protein
MKNATGWLLGLTLALGALASADEPKTSAIAPATQSQIFEYTMLELPNQFHEPCMSCKLDPEGKNQMLLAINDRAKAGWRLVTILRGHTDESIGVFERLTSVPNRN